MSESAVLKTKFGTARINTKGYYAISSMKEGNNGKALHRLIFEDFYQTKLPTDIHIHHNDGNKLNNEIWNLIPMTASEHKILHNKGNKWGVGRVVSDDERKLLSELNKGENNAMYGKDFSLDHWKKLSQLKNSTGFYRVHRRVRKKNNFATWEYIHRENGKVRTISSVNLLKLKEKVLLKGLDWFIIDLDKAEATLNGTDYNLEELV